MRPDFKGLRNYAAEFKLQPDHFVGRLRGLLQSDTRASIGGFNDLSEDVLALVEMHEPQVDMSVESEAFVEI